MSFNKGGNHEKKHRVNSWKKLGQTLALTGVLMGNTPEEAKSQDFNNNDTINKKEISIPDTNTTDKKNSISFDKGYNALETSLTNKGEARIRNLANFGMDIKLGEKQDLELGYSGLNEFTQNLESYFGRHVPNIGISGNPKLKAIGILKTTKDGVFDNKYGLRYLVSDEAGIDYGRIDVAGNKTGASATFFLGKNIGEKGTNIEFFTDVQFDGENKKILAPYTELQLNQNISKGFNVFVRGEVPGIEYNNGTYLLGVSKSF